MQTVAVVNVGNDVLYYEQENVPLAAKVTGILGDGVYVLAVFKPGETAITPTSVRYSEEARTGCFTLRRKAM